MKNILLNLLVLISLLTLVACGGGSGGTSPTPTPTQTTTYSLTFASGANGTLTGTTSQTVNSGSNSSAVTAVPATGYHFVNWTEGTTVVGISTALTIASVAANHSYTANFAVNSTTAAKTTAILTINLTGTLPANSGIAGAAFTLTLPTNVTPAVSSGTTLANGVVTPSGGFTGGVLTPPVYTAVAGTVPGTIAITIADSATAGTTQVGEVATITLQLANGATPVAGNFTINGVSVIDATLYGSIIGMGVSIGNVVLQ
jgi:hypothetical protein